MKPEYIILHTAAHGTPKKNYDTTAAQIDEWHRARDWDCIGYHYVVRLDGTIEPGRPEDKQGAHCRSMGMNRKSLGICFSGHADFHDWTDAQAKAGRILVRELMAKHSIPVANVLGHRETGAPKRCPGQLIKMDDVRRVITALNGLPQIDGTPSTQPAIAHPVDATSMFRAICDIFDDPQFQQLPQATRRKVMDLRKCAPFSDLTREDLV